MRIKIPAPLFVLLFANCLAVGTAQTNQLVEDLVSSGYVLGAPTNDISAAIRFSAVPQPNVALCLLYLGRTNSNQLWIAPPNFQRVTYRLYDSSGKAVPHSAAYHPPNKTYRFCYEVPKNVHNVYEGLMGVPFSMPYNQAILTNIFQIERDGNYNLIAEAQIMKINRDSSLDLVKFPPVAVMIHISGDH